MNGYVSGTERKPTNCFCLIFFLLYIVACIALAATGMIKGNFSKLVAGADTNGRLCGVDDGVTDYTKFYFYAGSHGELYGTCVKACPKTDSDAIECGKTQFVTSCTPLANKGYATEDILGLCLPSNTAGLDTTIGDQIDILT
jgi:hypothetical protein